MFTRRVSRKRREMRVGTPSGVALEERQRERKKRWLRLLQQQQDLQELGLLPKDLLMKILAARLPAQQPQQEEEDLQELGLLPKELLMKILAARLPVTKLFQLRLVCKSWDAMLRSPAFRKAWSLEAHHRPSECWFVMAANQLLPPFATELIAWSPSTGTWFQLPPFNPTFNNVARKRPWHPKQSVTQLIVASAGGLVCAVIDGPGGPKDYSVCVFNILTGAVKRLPPHLNYNPFSSPSSSSISISIMVTDSATGSYCVILDEVRDPHEFDHYDYADLGDHLQVYDSKSGCWKVGQPSPGHPHRKDISVLDGDLFYYASYGVLWAYIIEEDGWTAAEVRVPYNLHWPKVLKCKGRVLLVASTIACAHRPGNKYDISIEGYEVWELQIASPSFRTMADWVEVATSPSHFWDGFHYCNSSLSLREFGNTSQFSYACHGDLICITGVHYTDRDYEVQFLPPLVYDLTLGSWYRLPFYRGQMDFLCAFSFEPSLTAMVCKPLPPKEERSESI